MKLNDDVPALLDAAALLGVPTSGTFAGTRHEDPVRGGTRLLRLLSSAGAEAPQWPNAATLLAERAADLPAPAVAECLRLLAAALPPDVRPPGEPQADSVSDGRQTDEHPAIRRRRRSVSLDSDDFLEWFRRYADRDFLTAAEAAVARHGAAMLPPIPLTFWARDIAVYELMVPLLTAVLGRAFTSAELWVLDEALRGLPGTLDTLDAERLMAALDRALDR